jgi:hypothetical protein
MTKDEGFETILKEIEDHVPGIVFQRVRSTINVLKKTCLSDGEFYKYNNSFAAFSPDNQPDDRNIDFIIQSYQNEVITIEEFKCLVHGMDSNYLESKSVSKRFP